MGGENSNFSFVQNQNSDHQNFHDGILVESWAKEFCFCPLNFNFYQFGQKCKNIQIEAKIQITIPRKVLPKVVEFWILYWLQLTGGNAASRSWNIQKMNKHICQPLDAHACHVPPATCLVKCWQMRAFCMTQQLTK